MIPQKDSCPGRNTEQEAERNACLAGVPCQRLSSHPPQKQLHSMLSHSLVHHPLYHLGTAMHCPLVCPVSPMVMSEKEDADEDKGQGLQHGLEIAGE